MAVKVLIKRRFQEGKAMEVFALLNRIRVEAMNQTGYVTGETLVGYEDPQKILIISMWQSADDWFKWKEDPIRRVNEAKLEGYLTQPTEYDVYVLGAHPQRK